MSVESLVRIVEVAKLVIWQKSPKLAILVQVAGHATVLPVGGAVQVLELLVAIVHGGAAQQLSLGYLHCHTDGATQQHGHQDTHQGPLVYPYFLGTKV